MEYVFRKSAYLIPHSVNVHIPHSVPVPKHYRRENVTKGDSAGSSCPLEIITQNCHPFAGQLSFLCLFNLRGNCYLSGTAFRPFKPKFLFGTSLCMQALAGNRKCFQLKAIAL